jgi:RimJ/RimL family protein N-acetyltransferase
VIFHPASSLAVKPTLTGTSVLLRPFAFEQDAPALREMLQDPEVSRLTGSTHGPGEMPEWDAAAESGFGDWYSTLNDRTERLDLAVVDKASGQCVGEVVFNKWSEPNRSCNLRTVIGPTGRDRLGFVTEGVLREEHRWGGEWIDVTIMSMLAHEWDRHRGRP